MEEKNVYRELSQRTDGDIYIGVVGPVRTGKSTFIKRFMDALVLPNIHDQGVYQRTLDELPQSAAGKTIMTTEPKFIPEESVEVDLGDNVSFRVRMIPRAHDRLCGLCRRQRPRPYRGGRSPHGQDAVVGAGDAL